MIVALVLVVLGLVPTTPSFMALWECVACLSIVGTSLVCTHIFSVGPSSCNVSILQTQVYYIYVYIYFLFAFHTVFINSFTCFSKLFWPFGYRRGLPFVDASVCRY